MEALTLAAAAVDDAEALFIGAGAGMGVDSGLPDFRGPEGFWRAYPALRGHRFEEMADPSWFDRDPGRAWGFYGHRLNLYRQTVPHVGFSILRAWSERRTTAVFTSNVDGQFQEAGFSESQVCECHGSIHWLQDLYPGEHATISSAAGIAVAVNEETVRAAEPLPRHPETGGLLRPNILMFGDGHWLPDRTHAQHNRLERWLDSLQGRRLVIIEIGAGTAIPSVRRRCESMRHYNGTLIRINPREPEGPPGTLSLAMGGAAALEAIQQRLSPTSALSVSPGSAS